MRINVWESGYGEGDLPSEPTPTEYEQLVNLANKTKQIAQSVRDDADSGALRAKKVILVRREKRVKLLNMMTLLLNS